MRTKYILFLLATLAVKSPLAGQANNISVKIDALSGTYSVSSRDPGWTFAGSIGTKLNDVKSLHGTDAIGSYRAFTFKWKTNNNYIGTIRWYSNTPAVIFSLTLPDGSVDHSSPVAFPEFTTIPQPLYHFSYQDKEFAAPQFTLTQTSTPWLFFDREKNACVISPASDFIVSKLSGDGIKDISSALNSEVNNLPARFTHNTIMVIDKGIRNAWNVWGSALRDLYHRVRPANDAGKVLKYFGYWTDNGADYYYNYDTTKGYANTLLELRKRYRQEDIRLGYLQLDSWWYEKSIYDPNGKPDADHKNPHLPSGPWNRYGGLMEYKADPFLFPKGLPAFQQKIGLPLVTHNRWIDPLSPYNKKYKISGFAAVDPAFWKNIMDYIKSCGVICYEQDWLSYIYNKSPKMISDLKTGNAFTDGMANAAKADGINLQYCMAMPRYFLQGIKYNNLTTIRTSDDRFEPGKWMPFIFTSQFAYEMGIWPWCDVFKSGETGNMIVSVLSAGAVGTGDAIGKEDKANIMTACRNDGVIVKPDVPLLPLDEDYVEMAQNAGKPVLACTFTKHNNITTGYVYAFADAKTKDSEVNFQPSDIGMRGKVAVFDPAHNKVKVMMAEEQFQDVLPQEKYAYYIIAPVTSSGIAFLGDRGKIAATGKKRIADIQSSGKTLVVKVVFAPGEKSVTLQGYAPAEVVADKGKIDYNKTSHLFGLGLPAPAKGNIATVNIRMR